MMLSLFLCWMIGFQEHSIEINQQNQSLSFDAIFQTDLYNSPASDLHDHHFLVWREGRSSKNALLVAQVSDMAILKALKALGAQPGNNLTAKAWTKRMDLDVADPDQHVEGTPVQIEVAWGNQAPVTAADLFEDPGGLGFHFRVGGHKALAVLWRSGCVVCLESCPGARISNDTYTMRDLAKLTARFPLKAGVPPSGTPARVTVRLVAQLPTVKPR